MIKEFYSRKLVTKWKPLQIFNYISRKCNHVLLHRMWTEWKRMTEERFWDLTMIRAQNVNKSICSYALWLDIPQQMVVGWSTIHREASSVLGCPAAPSFSSLFSSSSFFSPSSESCTCFCCGFCCLRTISSRNLSISSWLRKETNHHIRDWARFFQVSDKTGDHPCEWQYSPLPL